MTNFFVLNSFDEEILQVYEDEETTTALSLKFSSQQSPDLGHSQLFRPRGVSNDRGYCHNVSRWLFERRCRRGLKKRHAKNHGSCARMQEEFQKYDVSTASCGLDQRSPSRLLFCSKNQ